MSCRPYALIGDLPLAAGAVIILVRERLRERGGFRPAEIPLLSAVFLMPFLMALFRPFPFSALVLGLLLLLIATQGTPATRLDAAPARGM